MNDDYADIVARLKANDPVSSWSPNPSAAFSALIGDHPELADSSEPRPRRNTDVVEVSIGDLTVTYQPESPRRLRRRRTALVALSAAASILAVAIGLVISRSATDGGGRSQLRTLTPTTTGSPSPTGATLVRPTPTHSPASPAIAPLPGASATVNATTVGGPPGPPPAPLSVHVTVSKTTLQPGESLVVTYSWSDGDGALLNVNHVESTALKVVRGPACQQRTHLAHPASGHGSYPLIFTYPGPNGPFVLAGIRLPFDQPERIRVGVQIDTGGNCSPWESVVATQWVTLVPPTAPVASATPSASPSPTPSSP